MINEHIYQIVPFRVGLLRIAENERMYGTDMGNEKKKISSIQFMQPKCRPYNFTCHLAVYSD